MNVERTGRLLLNELVARQVGGESGMNVECMV